MAEEQGTKAATEGDEVILDRGTGRKILGVTLPPWRSPISQGMWGNFHVAEKLGELTDMPQLFSSVSCASCVPVCVLSTECLRIATENTDRCTGMFNALGG